MRQGGDRLPRVAELDAICTELGLPVQRVSWADVDNRADRILNMVSATLQGDWPSSAGS